MLRYDAASVAARVPPDFLSDGCSCAPDRLFGVDLTPACRLHDAAYCARLWPPGTLDQAWRSGADRQLGIDVRAVLPFGLGWVGWAYFWAVHRFGGDSSFDSCGEEAGERCRHGMPMPDWMK